jgi:MoaA/NifB/PqqE/SkfB family radical SAM enzyme
MRDDLEAIVRYASNHGVPVALSPAVSDGLLVQRMEALYLAGARSVSISLDGIGVTHDQIRGAEDHFSRTMDAIDLLQRIGYRVQVNTTVMRENAVELGQIAELLLAHSVPTWEVFFLIEVGRGAELRSLSPEENEDVMGFLRDVSPYFGALRTVEGPFYRRVLASAPSPRGALYERLVRSLPKGPPRRSQPSHSAMTRDGAGIVFVSHLGEVFPSGFLPIAVGNVRDTPIGTIYREAALMRAVREGQLGGRCGVCPFGSRCGGSRARAYATFGDPLAEDPACGFDPLRDQSAVELGVHT